MPSAIARMLSVGLLYAAVVPLAFGQSLDEIIERYETFDRAGNPEEAAKANGEDPRNWTLVSPGYIEARADSAAQMMAALDALGYTSEGPEVPILR